MESLQSAESCSCYLQLISYWLVGGCAESGSHHGSYNGKLFCLTGGLYP